MVFYSFQLKAKDQDRALMRTLLDLRALIHQMRSFRRVYSPGGGSDRYLHTIGGSSSLTSLSSLAEDGPLSVPAPDLPISDRDIWNSFSQRTVSLVAVNNAALSVSPPLHKSDTGDLEHLKVKSFKLLSPRRT